MSTLSSRISVPVLSTTAKNISLAFLGSIAIAVSSQITVPMFPVPMTMQTFAVLSVGMALGSRFGALAVMMYLAEGLTGLPVFAGGAFGLTALLGASGGYLLGFVASAFVVGKLAENGFDKTFGKAFFAMVVGNVVIYIFGLTQLGAIAGWNNPILAWGLVPFIVGDFVKAAIASALFPALWKKNTK